MREQFEALGMDTFDRCGPATDEAIRLFRAASAQVGEVSFTGDVYRFQPIWFLPKPARPGGPPIWVGGNGRRSIRRAAELGDGWHTVRIGLDELRTGVATLHELLDRNGRSAADVVISGKFKLYCPGTGPWGEPHESELTGSAELIAARLRSYRDAGLQYLVLDQLPDSPAAGAPFGRQLRRLLYRVEAGAHLRHRRHAPSPSAGVLAVASLSMGCPTTRSTGSLARVRSPRPVNVSGWAGRL